MELNKPKDLNKITDFEKKHIPTIEIHSDKFIVKVGYEITHPMEENHYIAYIELFKDNQSIAKNELKPGNKPEAEFKNVLLGKLKAQALCNLHGLWESI